MVQDMSTVGFWESELESEYIIAHYLITAPVGANKLICELSTIWLEFLNLFRIMLFLICITGHILYFHIVAPKKLSQRHLH